MMNKNVRNALAMLLSLTVIGGTAAACEPKAEKSVTESSTATSTTTMEDATTTESEKEAPSSETPDEPTSVSENVPATAKNAEEMLEAFLLFCEDNGVAYAKTDGNEDGEDYTRYQTAEHTTLFNLSMYSDEDAAKESVQDAKSYGGWYEEDLVIKSIKIDEDGLDLEGYYCQTPDGENMLFVLGAKETLAFHFEAVNDEQVKFVEDVLLEMGIELNK